MAQPTVGSALSQLIGALWLDWIIIAALVFSILWPMALLSITLNIRGIRKELRDIAEQLSLPSRKV